MRLGVIGAGHIGGNVARQAVRAGHEVKLSFSREPAGLDRLAAAAQNSASSNISSVEPINCLFSGKTGLTGRHPRTPRTQRRTLRSRRGRRSASAPYTDAKMMT